MVKKPLRTWRVDWIDCCDDQTGFYGTQRGYSELWNVGQQYGKHLARCCTSLLQTSRKPFARQPRLVVREFPISDSANLYGGQK